jgi:Transcription factor Iwr1
MTNISIKDGKSPYEKFFGVPPPITPETCVNFGRIGYVTYGHALKNKYKPRAFKCHMVGCAMNHSAHTYKFLIMNQENQEKLLLQGMSGGNISEEQEEESSEDEDDEDDNDEEEPKPQRP